MPVLAVEALVAEVLAEVVAALDAEPAVAAAGVRGARHAHADLPAEVGRALPELDHLARPLVARDEREGLRPEAGEVALDDVRVGAADGDRLDAAEQLVATRPRALDLLDGEAVRLVDDERAHQITATGSIIDPVAPRIASGSATNRNSRAPLPARSSRSRLSMM